jgi:hypothetical protein
LTRLVDKWVRLSYGGNQSIALLFESVRDAATTYLSLDGTTVDHVSDVVTLLGILSAKMISSSAAEISSDMAECVAHAAIDVRLDKTADPTRHTLAHYHETFARADERSRSTSRKRKIDALDGP